MAESCYLENRKMLKYISLLHNKALHNFDNKTANINTKNCSLSAVLTATSKNAKMIKKDITQHHVDIQAM